MSHTISILDSGLVEIVHSGRLTIKEASASRKEAGALMAEQGLRLALVIISSIEHSDSTMDMFDFNVTHYDVFPPQTRLAVVIPHDPKIEDSARFAETVAINRGIKTKIFLDRTAALAWLNNQTV